LRCTFAQNPLTVPAGVDEPFGVAFDGTSIWVTSASSTNVAKIRVSDGAILGTFAVRQGGSDSGLRGIAFDGANLWVAYFVPNTTNGTVTKVRASDGATLGTFSVGANAYGVVFDGANIWVSNESTASGNGTLTKLRASDGAYLGNFPVGAWPTNMVFDGANIWVANSMSNNVTKLRASDGTLLGAFPVGQLPISIAFDGASIWVPSNAGTTVTKLRASDGALLGTSSGLVYPSGIAFDGSNMWVVNGGANSLSELRISDGTVLGTFPVGSRPEGVAFDGANMWVANLDSNTLTRVSTTGTAPELPSLTVVNSANYAGVPVDAVCCPNVAPGSLVSMFGANIAPGITLGSDAAPAPLPTRLAGVSATITDASGNMRPIGLIAVAQGQVNAVLPSDLQPGMATVTLTTSTGIVLSGPVTLDAVMPALFSADQTGNWLAAAQVVTTHADGSQSRMGSIATCTGNLVYNGYTWSGCVPEPINLGSSTDTVVLELFGTGIRAAAAIANENPQFANQPSVFVFVGPSCNDNSLSSCYQPSLQVLYAGPQGAGAPGSFYGLDQVNVLLPRSLAGSGAIYLTVEALSGYVNGEGEVDNSYPVFIYIQ